MKFSKPFARHELGLFHLVLDENNEVVVISQALAEDAVSDVWDNSKIVKIPSDMEVYIHCDDPKGIERTNVKIMKYAFQGLDDLYSVRLGVYVGKQKRFIFSDGGICPLTLDKNS